MAKAPVSVPPWGRGVDRSSKLLPHAARQHNRALVLQTLMTLEVASRADIARETKLTRVTVSDLIADLIDTGLVEELGQSTSGRPGKPATLLQVEPNSRNVVGLDLSNLGVLRASVFNLRGEIVWEDSKQTEKLVGDEAASAVLDFAKHAAGAAQAPLLGVGVGSPGIISPAGTVVTAPNFRWENYPLGAILEEQLAVPVHVANDANAAVMAATRIDGLQDDLMLITIGYGVGSGVLLDGVPRLGPQYAAGEIGHLVVGTDGGPSCACGKQGCLENWVSEPNLRRALDDAVTQMEQTDVLVEAGRRLGIVIAPVVGALNLTDVVINGPEELLGGVFLESVDSTLRERLLAPIVEPLTVHMMPNSETAVLRGAANVVLAAELGVH